MSPTPQSKLPDEVPSAAEYGLLRAWLAQHGFSQEQINQGIGVGAQGRTRAQICAQMRAWLATLPAAQQVAGSGKPG